MSRIGKIPIEVPSGIKVAMAGSTLSVKGPGGSLGLSVRDEVSVDISGSTVKVSPRDGGGRISRELHGLTRTLIANMIKGVSEGFEKKLEIVGVGYKAEVKGDGLVLYLGYSKPVTYKLPEGIKASVDKQTSVTVKGADKQRVGQAAAEIRAFRKPEPYKGKGVRYAGEQVRRKAGKAGKGAA
ncbi:MAG: 50S ribosomal protein L6 [Thermodesulfobacteriota bacterium]